MSSSDVIHPLTMIAGCEALTSGDSKNPNAVYAFAVLKLHASDDGFIAGTEGFMDAVKKGAKNVGTWIAELIKAIKNWILGTDKEAKDFEKTYKELKAKHQSGKSSAPKTSGDSKDKSKEDKGSSASEDKPKEEKAELKINTAEYIPQMEKIIENLEKINGVKLEILKHTLDVSTVISDYKTAIKQASEGSQDIWGLTETVVKIMGDVSKQYRVLMDKLNAWHNSTDSKQASATVASNSFNETFGYLQNAKIIANKIATSLQGRLGKQIGN